MIASILRTAVIAGAAAATVWSIQRWLELRAHAEKHTHTKRAIQDWENEGGAVITPSMSSPATIPPLSATDHGAAAPGFL